MRRLLLVLFLAALATFGLASTASAHTQLIGSDPANGARLAAPPSQISLTFNEPVQAEATTVTVTGADGTAWAVGSISAKDATLTMAVTPAGPAGEYTLSYKIGSADDHAVTGAVKFAMTVPAATTTTTVPPTTTTVAPSVSAVAQSGTGDEGAAPAGVWIGGAVLLIALVAVVLVLARRKRAQQNS